VDLFAEESDKDRYLITYSDLITLLLGLFIILYAISNVDVKKYQSVMGAMGNIFGSAKSAAQIVPGKFTGQAIQSPKNSLAAALQSLKKENAYGNSVSFEENERGITIHILDDILFNSGSAELNDGSKNILHKLAVIIRTLPNDIRVEGHTDNLPVKSAAFPSNWHLSVARALNTAYHLIETEGLSPDKVSIVGYSEYKPIASNSTDEGKSNNRRVDIVILNK
jgi:chemotaxis protein MotB